MQSSKIAKAEQRVASALAAYNAWADAHPGYNGTQEQEQLYRVLKQARRALAKAQA